MKSFLSFLLVCLLMACADTTTVVTGYKGKQPIGYVKTSQRMWGTLNYSNSLYGIIQTGELNIGFQQFTSMVTSLVAAYAAFDLAKAQQITQQLKDAGATQTQLAQINATAAVQSQTIAAGVTNATTAAKLSHFQTAVGAGLFTPVPLPTSH